MRVAVVKCILKIYKNIIPKNITYLGIRGKVNPYNIIKAIKFQCIAVWVSIDVLSL